VPRVLTDLLGVPEETVFAVGLWPPFWVAMEVTLRRRPLPPLLLGLAVVAATPARDSDAMATARARSLLCCCRAACPAEPTRGSEVRARLAVAHSFLGRDVRPWRILIHPPPSISLHPSQRLSTRLHPPLSTHGSSIYQSRGIIPPSHDSMDSFGSPPLSHLPKPHEEHSRRAFPC
jgi:hypothetical protein